MGMYNTTGEILLKGQSLALNDTKNALEKGVAFVSEDRRAVGLLLDSSIEDNIAVTTMQIKEGFLKTYGPLKSKRYEKINSHALKMIEDLDIRCTGPHQQRVG